jgi:hypothetical protein
MENTIITAEKQIIKLLFKASVSLALSVWGRSIFSKTLWKRKTKQKKIAIRCCYLLTRQLFT